MPRAVLADERSGKVARALEQRPVGAEAREAQVADPRLARPEQLALAPQLEVALGELEAVGRLDERLQARLSRDPVSSTFGREISRQ